MARIKLCGFGQCGLGFVYLIISLGLKALLIEYFFPFRLQLPEIESRWVMDGEA